MLKHQRADLSVYVAFACGLFMASALPASAQIVFDNASFSDLADTFDHTIGGGSERMLVVGVGREGGGDATVTYNGVSMTRIPGAEVRIESGALQWVDLFWLDESGPLPAAGTYEVAVSPSLQNCGPDATCNAVAAISLENVAQGPPEATASNADLESEGLTDMSVEITTLTAGAWLIDALGDGQGLDGGGNTRDPLVQTVRGTAEGGSNSMVMSTYEVATAGTTLTGYTISADGLRTGISVAAFAPGTPPVFSIQPRGATVLIGSSHLFEVALSDPVSPSYQWMRDIGSGAENVGTDASTLELMNLQESDSGDYWVVITDDGGPFTSDKATLRVVTSVPTAQTWGLLCVTLLLLVSGAYFVRRRALQRR